MAFFNDTKDLLAGRVPSSPRVARGPRTPPSRTRQLITNVRVIDDDGTSLGVESNFLLYRITPGLQEDS